MSNSVTTKGASNEDNNSDDVFYGSIPFDNSWIRQLSPETPENVKKSLELEGLSEDFDNRGRRPVYNGHYVMVKPTGLDNPRLVLLSQDVANLLKLTPQQTASTPFLNYVSGNLPDHVESWATPYALSIMGSRYTSNCPYGTGNGYGDGRAMSIGEFHGMELQLKGGGKTPFCRGADGRAVLRSSIREFLASEAMHYLGVRTTRALSLIKSETVKTQRPWYTPEFKLQLPSLDDPRLAQYTEEQRKQILARLRNEKADPNRMQRENCAITCRVCKSFTRIGHLDLFSRRVQKQQTSDDSSSQRYDTTTQEWKELEQIIWHACFREYKETAYDPFWDENNIAGAAKVLLQESMVRLAEMVTHWVRVGFAQGNFNADNCLVGGHTMDYGPFGFMDEYHPFFAKWTGSGEHFGFMNQPTAGLVNYQVLVESVVPVIAATTDEDPQELIESFMTKAQEHFQTKVDQIFRRKMGFSVSNDMSDALWITLEQLLRTTRVDWTLFWRQLTRVAAEFDDYSNDDYESMLEVLIGDDNDSPFYEPLTDESRSQYLEWIKRWRELLRGEKHDIAEQMRMANPKYVLREWMLVQAYTKANEGDEDLVHELYQLIQNPYDDGTPEQEERYYRRAPIEALTTGGTAFMS